VVSRGKGTGISTGTDMVMRRERVRLERVTSEEEEDSTCLPSTSVLLVPCLAEAEALGHRHQETPRVWTRLRPFTHNHNHNHHPNRDRSHKPKAKANSQQPRSPSSPLSTAQAPRPHSPSPPSARRRAVNRDSASSAP
jgi:hypothetical protein